MRKNKYICFLWATTILTCMALYGCKEKYLPEIKDNNANYLVVEGLINTGNDSTLFTLSRTYKLNNKAVVGAEKGAIVNVESESGTTYLLPELVKAGSYGRPSLNLDPAKKHRLRIRTKDNREYMSDFVESKTSPPIDAIKYDFKNNGLNIYADTKDPSGKSRYYLYSYIETWEYNAQLISFFKIENHQILRRNYPEDFIYTCWHNVPSTDIVLGSTANLTQDQLADKTVSFIPAKSSKLAVEYSILIKQKVLTKEGFDFWETLKKNTQDLGGIFDPQPSQLFGNIRSTTNPSEIVIGFISAGTVTEKRLTLTLAELPREWITSTPVDSTCLQSVKRLAVGVPVNTYLTGPAKPVFTPIDEVLVVGIPTPVAYTATDILTCVDCRALGGTNKKPSYWR